MQIPSLPKMQPSLVRTERQHHYNHNSQHHSSLRAANDNNDHYYNEKGQLFSSKDHKTIHGIISRDKDSDIYSNKQSSHQPISSKPSSSSSIDLWKTYCYIVTCCLSPFILRYFGNF